MDVVYKSNKLEKTCTNNHYAMQLYGIAMSEKIKLRINQIRAASSVEEMLKFHIGRCHALKGRREGQFALDLVQPCRLIFEKNVIKEKHCIYLL